jgi:hypothetical protein
VGTVASGEVFFFAIECSGRVCVYPIDARAGALRRA